MPSATAVQAMLPPGERCEQILPLHGDGSARRFLRVFSNAGSHVLLVGPDAAENAAYVRIARHLAARGIRVPAIRAVDAGRGWILLEDLGDRNLSQALAEPGGEREALYAPVLDLLARTQLHGAQDFELGVGFAPAPYGPELMVEGEGLYFVREFAQGMLGLPAGAGLRTDLERLATIGAAAPAGFFLHRDFQSRNVQLTPEGPALLDFQGARPGPLAYDAAALVLDPYAANPAPLRARLLATYRRRLDELGGGAAWSEDGWFAVGAFRLLQALGAFGKLGGRLGKAGFLEHAGAALALLLEHLGPRGRRECPALWALTGSAQAAWEGRQGAGGGVR